jgi:hypothetical protein
MVIHITLISGYATSVRSELAAMCCLQVQKYHHFDAGFGEFFVKVMLITADRASVLLF